jgi:hypothetical protein
VTSASRQLARQLEALALLGLERASVPPVETEVLRLDRATAKLVGNRPAMWTHVTVTALGASPEQLEEAAGRGDVVPGEQGAEDPLVVRRLGHLGRE